MRVVEVNKERGRIGLRLADDPAVEGKSVEELSQIGTGGRWQARRRSAGVVRGGVAATGARRAGVA